MTEHPRPLKELLATGELIIAPGVYDGLSALTATRAGFPALYLSSFAISASLLAEPDAGFLNLTHMEDRIRTISKVTAAPVIADADTGFGGPHNAAAAVRAYARAGAAAIQIEDQVFPKRCGHTKNREVIPLEGAALKIMAASEAREDDIQIIARTDARTSHGLDEALRRGEAYLKAGADILFIESPESENELRRIAGAFKGTPLVANMVEGGRTPYLSPAELSTLGYAIAIYPLLGLSAAADTLARAFAGLAKGDTKPAPAMDFAELCRLMGFERIWAMDDKRIKGD